MRKEPASLSLHSSALEDAMRCNAMGRIVRQIVALSDAFFPFLSLPFRSSIQALSVSSTNDLLIEPPINVLNGILHWIGV